MALPPWSIELIRRGLTDVARRAGDGEALEKIRTQATEILNELPETAARGIESVMKTAEAGKKSVERWARKHTALSVPILNASGVLQQDVGCGVPISPLAIELGNELIAGDSITGVSLERRLTRRFDRVLPGGNASIAIATNFHAALTALPFLLPDHQLVVHRHHAVRLPDGLPLPDACGLFAPVIQDVGSADQVDAKDFAGLEEFCAIMADVGREPLELLDLKRSGARQAVVLPVATIRQSEIDQIPSAEAALTAGASFVVLPGDGIAGGPACGIIIGRSAEIEKLKSSAAWRALSASDAVKAMMLATMEIAADSADGLPIQALLTASLDNLDSRAQRMVTRLGGVDSIAEVSVSKHEAKLTADGRWSLPSRQLHLKHQSLSSSDWQAALAEQVPVVLAAVDGEHLCIDLRWIAAADDSKLAEALS